MNLIRRSPAARKRRITTRTYGKNHGPTTRLMSPSDLGEILKPFVFLDLFHHEGEPFSPSSSRASHSNFFRPEKDSKPCACNGGD